MNLQEQIKNDLFQFIDSTTQKTLKETESIRFFNVDEEASLVTAIIAIETTGGVAEKTLSRQIAKLIKIDYKFKGIKLQFEPLNTENESLEKKTHYIAITSGKGGVGKSTVSANLAIALNRLGKKVGLIDADIYGPSLPQIFQKPKAELRVSRDNKIIPPMVMDLPLISTEYLLEDDKPLMWRGPMLGRMLNHFFQDVLWDEDIEFMIIDLPPGTGDVAMDIQKLIPEAKVIVVTTPHPAASHIAVKSGYMAESLGHEILGVIENMSYYSNPVNGAKEAIFGIGGGLEVAKQLHTELLTSIPIGQTTEVTSHSIFSAHEEIGVIYLGLANKILKLLHST